MSKTKVAFLEGRLFCQSELFAYLINFSDWLVKSRPFKKATYFDHVNWLIVTNKTTHYKFSKIPDQQLKTKSHSQLSRKKKLAQKHEKEI